MEAKYIQITDAHNCDGCTACSSICPKGAIDMSPDKYGFLYPIVNMDKCINCGLCTKVCPIIKSNDSEGHEDFPKCFAVRLKNTDEIRKSRSGGTFKAVGDYILRKGGVIYGAAFDKSWNVSHVRAATVEELELLRKSKYVQSDMQNIFHAVSSDLQNGLWVCFSGTPCQCAGLLSYLKIKKTDINHLFCIDIVCHGVPSPSVWKDYVAWIREKYHDEITAINMRDKTIVGWNGHEESFSFLRHKKIYRHSFRVLYHTELITRKSCFTCRFAKIQRPSDLTLADFWQWKKITPNFNKDNLGVSQILVNSEKGMTLFNEIASSIIAIPINLQDSKQYNMEHSTPEPFGRDEAEKVYSTMGFKHFMRKYSDWNMYTYLLMQYRRIKHIYRNYKQ